MTVMFISLTTFFFSIFSINNMPRNLILPVDYTFNSSTTHDR